MSFTSDPLDRAVVFACDFKPRIVGGVSVIPNYGKAGGAPTWLTLGDGTTSTTFPTPLAGWGTYFDGNDYVNTGVVDRYERTDQFSLYYYGAINAGVYVICNWDNAMRKGIYLATNSATKLILSVLESAIGSTFSSNSTNVQMQATNISTYVMIWNGHVGGVNALSLFKNNLNLLNLTITDTLSGSIKNGKPFLLGARNGNPIAPGLPGYHYAFGIFDGILTPRDIQILDRMVKSNIK